MLEQIIIMLYKERTHKTGRAAVLRNYFSVGGGCLAGCAGGFSKVTPAVFAKLARSGSCRRSSGAKNELRALLDDAREDENSPLLPSGCMKPYR